MTSAQLLENKVALITGAGRGIGAAAGRLFAREGARVVLAARSEHEIATVARSIRDDGGVADWVVLDLADADSVRTAVNRVVELHGRLDVAFNNGAVPGPHGFVDQVPDEELDQIYAVNFKGQWVAMAAEAEAIRSTAGQGAIVNTSSLGSRRANLDHPAYGALKRALNSLTDSAAVTWGPENIRVNAIAPGPTRTEMIDGYVTSTPGALEQMQGQVALGRLAAPSEIAEAAAWLLSDRASYVTGALLAVDGGAGAQ
ncbi:SDR family NAD(P)-dependent oxidoreductase [Actinoplanes sp. CA-054009]